MGKDIEDLVDYLKMRMEANPSPEKTLGMMEVAAYVAGISADEMLCLVEDRMRASK